MIPIKSFEATRDLDGLWTLTIEASSIVGGYRRGMTVDVAGYKRKVSFVLDHADTIEDRENGEEEPEIVGWWFRSTDGTRTRILIIND